MCFQITCANVRTARHKPAAAARNMVQTCARIATAGGLSARTRPSVKVFTHEPIASNYSHIITSHYLVICLFVHLLLFVCLFIYLFVCFVLFVYVFCTDSKKPDRPPLVMSPGKQDHNSSNCEAKSAYHICEFHFWLSVLSFYIQRHTKPKL